MEIYVVHGCLMGVAWLCFAPLAVGAALLRRCGHLQSNGTWFKIHRFFNTSVAVLTIVAFILIRLGGDDRRRRLSSSSSAQESPDSEDGEDDDESSFASEDTHGTIGFTIFILVIIQVLGGYLRPHLPNHKAAHDVITQEKGIEAHEQSPDSVASTSNRSIQEDAGGGGQSDVDGEITSRTVSVTPDAGREMVATNSSHHASDGRAGGDEEADAKKSTIRVVWEWGHRILGSGMLICAWINCFIGISIADD